MKRIILSLALILSSIMASAQIAGNNVASVSSDAPSSFGVVSFAYNPMNLKISEGGKSITSSFNGLSLSWLNASKIAPVSPLYVQYGAEVQWSFRREGSYKSDFLSIKIPASVLYSINLFGSKFNFAPFAGLDAIVYALGKSGGEDFFSNSGLGVKMNRFNLAWHAGAQFMYGRFFLNLSYEGPIVGFYQKDGIKVNSNQTVIGVGIVL